MKKLFFALISCLFFLSLLTSPANAVPVQYTGVYGQVVSITGIHNGSVWAGIYKLTVDGTAVDSFCIDILQESNRSLLQYDIVPLSNAPQSPIGPMKQAQALAISKLWDKNYNPAMSTSAAAALQVAIWEVLVDGPLGDISAGNFMSTYVGAQALLNELTNWNGTANLFAFSNPSYQDYATRAPVPEPATMLLFGAGLIGLAGFGRKKLFKSA